VSIPFGRLATEPSSPKKETQKKIQSLLLFAPPHRHVGFYYVDFFSSAPFQGEIKKVSGLVSPLKLHRVLLTFVSRRHKRDEY